MVVLCPLGRLCHFVRLCAVGGLCRLYRGWVRFAQVMLPAARYVPRQQGTSEVLLAFQLVAHQVPNKLIPSLVLCLIDERYLVLRNVVRVHHTFASSCADLCEGVAPSTLFFRNWGCSFAMYGGVFAVGLLAVIIASAVLFGDFAREVMDRVFVNNLCHMCSEILYAEEGFS